VAGRCRLRPPPRPRRARSPHGRRAGSATTGPWTWQPASASPSPPTASRRCSPGGWRPDGVHTGSRQPRSFAAAGRGSQPEGPRPPGPGGCACRLRRSLRRSRP
jgi:hypothetical protein